MIMMTSFVVLSTSSKLGLAGPPLISRDAPSQPSQLALIASNPPLHYIANDIPHSRLHANLYTSCHYYNSILVRRHFAC
jgi:hypothetical protein